MVSRGVCSSRLILETRWADPLCRATTEHFRRGEEVVDPCGVRVTPTTEDALGLVDKCVLSDRFRMAKMTCYELHIRKPFARNLDHRATGGRVVASLLYR